MPGILRAVFHVGDELAGFECLSASTPEEKSIGLQSVDELKENQGMVFSYDASTNETFHMGAVPFPIDILGVTESGMVSRVCADISPGDQNLYHFQNVKYVVELPGGTCARLGIGEGTEVEISREDDDLIEAAGVTKDQAEEALVNLMVTRQLPLASEIAETILRAYEQNNDYDIPEAQEALNLVNDYQYREHWLDVILEGDQKGFLQGYDRYPGEYQEALKSLVADELARLIQKMETIDWAAAAKRRVSFRKAVRNNGGFRVTSTDTDVLVMVDPAIWESLASVLEDDNVTAALASMLEVYESDTDPSAKWQEIVSTLDVWGRDIVVRTLMSLGHTTATQLLSAQV